MRRKLFSFLRGASYVYQVTGADGDLTILNGQTVQIPAGSIKHYNSVNIHAGGTLEIIQNATLQKTEIGCRGSFTLNGQIIARCSPSGTGGSISGTSSIGAKAFSATVSQAFGGAGSSSYGASGGAGTSNGLGGGGAGSYAYNNGNAALGGNGGTGGGNGGAGQSVGGGPTPARPGGTGMATLSNGGNGGIYYNPGGGYGGAGGGSGGGGSGVAEFYDSELKSWSTATSQGGGGGGYKGSHGQYLFLFIEGTISGTGTIHVSGTNGYAGGAAPNAGWSGSAGGAGGGGGGAGGSGGKVDIWARAGQSQTFYVSHSAGFGGGGGAGSQGTYINCGPGATGGNGSIGSSTFNVI